MSDKEPIIGGTGPLWGDSRLSLWCENGKKVFAIMLPNKADICEWPMCGHTVPHPEAQHSPNKPPPCPYCRVAALEKVAAAAVEAVNNSGTNYEGQHILLWLNGVTDALLLLREELRTAGFQTNG